MKNLSASALDRAENCPLSVSLPAVVDHMPRPYRDCGTAVHKFLAAVEDGATPEEAILQVPELHRSACAVIDLEAMPHGKAGWRAEVALAYDPVTDSGRVLHTKGDRDYSECTANEIPGTADLLGMDGDTVVVLDVKTGHNFLGDPADALQLLHNALAAARAFGATSALVGWIRLIGGEPRFQRARLGVMELLAARDRLLALTARVDEAELSYMADPDGVSPVIGEHCRYCPAFFRCPAQVALASAVTKAAVNEGGVDITMPVEKRTQFHRYVMAVKALTARLEDALETMAREEPIPLEDGRVFGPRAELREYLNPVLTEKVLTEIDPQFAADVVQTKQSASKEAITKHAQKYAPPQMKRKKFVDEVLGKLRVAGAAYTVETITVKARKPLKEQRALAEEEE